MLISSPGCIFKVWFLMDSFLFFFYGFVYICFFIFEWIFMDPKTKKKMARWVFSWAIWRWKVVGSVVGAASGQVGSAPFFEGWGCGFLLPEEWTMFFENLGSNIQNMSLKFCWSRLQQIKSFFFLDFAAFFGELGLSLQVWLDWVCGFGWEFVGLVLRCFSFWKFMKWKFTDW